MMERVARVADAAASCGSRTHLVCSLPPSTPCPLQINYLFTTSALLIRLKRQELLYRARQQRKAERAADATTGAAAGSGGEQAPAAAGAAGAGGSELKKRR